MCRYIKVNADASGVLDFPALLLLLPLLLSRLPICLASQSTTTCGPGRTQVVILSGFNADVAHSQVACAGVACTAAAPFLLLLRDIGAPGDSEHGCLCRCWCFHQFRAVDMVKRSSRLPTSWQGSVKRLTSQ